MTAHATSLAGVHQTSKATSLPGTRPVYEEVEYDSEAETLVGSESDDDCDAHPASANNHPAASYGVTGRASANKPGASTQSNIDAAVRARKAKEMEDAVQPSQSLIADAGRGQGKGNPCQDGTMAPAPSKW